MIKDERGEIEDVLMVFILLLAGTAIVMFVMGLFSNHAFDNWAKACVAHGGYTKSTTHLSSGAEWYDCIKENKMFVVPGYEGYQKDRPAGLPTENL